MRLPILVGICVLLAGRSSAQDVTLWGALPTVQFGGILKQRTDYFFQTGGETYWGVFSEEMHRADFLLRHLDLSAGLSWDLGTNWNIAASFLLRRRKPLSEQPGWELRPFGQITHIKRWRKYRLRNRFRSEQRVVKPKEGSDWSFDWRTRYRISLDFPLQGERLDFREFYLNTSLAMLLTLNQADVWFYRNPRAYIGLGYKLDARRKLETGFEYRTQNGNRSGLDERILFWRINWVHVI